MFDKPFYFKMKLSLFHFLQGHYRFCDALSFLGEHRKALEANERGQDLCRDNPEGMKGLIEQHEKLKNQMEEARGNHIFV